MAAEKNPTSSTPSTPITQDHVRLGQAIKLVIAEKGLSQDNAYLLLTMTADLEVCQVVNGLRTARVCIDRTFYEGLPGPTA